MSTVQAASTPRRSHPPLWLVEGLDVVEQRRPAFIAVTGGVIALGGVLAVAAPALLPPVPLIGAAVGLAALLLGMAVAIALDAADLRLRGPRHVGAAGGELVAVLPTVAEASGAAVLANAVLEAREPGTPLLLGLAASSRDVRPTAAWTDALATALEAEGVSVLRIDLASGPSPSPGLLEVVRDGTPLASAVRFGPERRLARLGAGADHRAALEALAALPGRLPRDLDVLLVALPMAASREVVAAVRSLDHVLIVAQRDRTSRVELIAGLDAMESAGTRAQVALLDDRTAGRLAVPIPSGAAEEGADPEVRAPHPAPAPEADDPDPDAGSARRDLGLVHGAAEATAIALAGAPAAPIDPLPQVPSEQGGAVPVGGELSGGSQPPAPHPPTPVELEARPDPNAELAPERDPEEADVDTTDEADPAGAEPALSDADAEHDEMLRTTARLAVLIDDLEAPADEPPRNAP